MTSPEGQGQVDFLLDIGRLLDEGSFVATYKYALLTALADLAVEEGGACVGPVRFTTTRIAEKFIQYYWRQTMPWVSAGGTEGGILKQNTDRQAAILNLIAQARVGAEGSLARARGDARSWQTLVRKVERVVQIMPLWKLQTIGRQEVPFLYRDAGNGREIELLPGVAANLRLFHGMITDMVQARWVRHVAAIGANRHLLGPSADLREFLFGSDRQPLDVYRPLLREIQGSECFYCRATLRGPGDVDHFVPWTRYPVDLGHNFVLAHPKCNSKKRDYLAAEEHLEHWLRRNDTHGAAMRDFFTGRGINADRQASIRITRWAYETAEVSRAHLWIKGEEVKPISPTWRLLFDGPLHGGLLVAADRDNTTSRNHGYD